MITFEPNKLWAFENGIEKIHCKHSPGKKHAVNALPGIHQHREILFVLQGKSEFPLNHKLIPVKPGHAVLIDSWIDHCANYSPSDRNLLFLWIFLFSSRPVAMVHQVDGVGNVIHITDSILLPFDLSMTINRRWDDLNRLPPDEAAANVDRFMKSPLTLLLDEFRLHFWKKELHEEKLEDNLSLVNSIQQIIEAKNGRDCSLEQLEKITGFNRFYIAHTFKNVNGLTIGDHINKIRMNFYESALKQGLSRKQIAFELGFSNSSSLSTWFRKYSHKTEPAESE